MHVPDKFLPDANKIKFLEGRREGGRERGKKGERLDNNSQISLRYICKDRLYVKISFTFFIRFVIVKLRLFCQERISTFEFVEILYRYVKSIV